MIKKMLLLVLVLCGMVNVSEARTIDKIDVNSDGKVSETEMRVYSERLYDRSPASKKSKVEKQAAVAEIMGVFEKLDTNHDGYVTKDEK